MYEGRRKEGRDRKGFEGGENSESIGSGAAGLAGFQQEGHGCGAASRAKGLSYSDYSDVAWPLSSLYRLP